MVAIPGIRTNERCCTMSEFNVRFATIEDLERLEHVMSRAITHLQQPFLSPEQVRASHRVMGLDSQLIRDRSYFVVEQDERIAGCGGWSPRSTLFGGDNSLVSREPRFLDPSTEPARIRAMYTDPDFARRGIGRLILGRCEDAARASGFLTATMMATMAGAALYRVCGYRAVEPVREISIEGVIVPLVRMEKQLY